MRKLKKALSLTLALALSLALAVHAFAAPMSIETTGYDYIAGGELGYDYGEVKATKFNFSDAVSQEMVKTYDGALPLVTVKVGTTITPECLWPFTAFSEACMYEDGDYDRSDEETARYFYAMKDGTPYTLTEDNIGLWLFWDGNAGRNIFFLNVIAGDGTTPTQPEQPGTPDITVENIPSSGTAVANTQMVTVDGKAVEFQTYALIDANGNAANYIKLRDMAYILNGTKAQFNVGYSNETGITATSGQPYQANGSEMNTPFSGGRGYTGGGQSVQINGKAVEMTAISLLDDNGGGYTYFKIRDLGKALGFNVGYSAERGVYIESDKPYVG